MRATWIAVVVLLAACGPQGGTGGSGGNPEQESAAAKQAIEAANAEFVQHFNQGHGDLAAAQYLDDAQLMVVGNPVAKGKQQIAAMVNDLAPAKATLTLTADKVTAVGPMAVERGTWSLTLTPPGAPGPVTESGTFIVHWQKVGDKWLRADDIATSDKPLPPPPPPGPPPAPATK